MGCQCPPMRMVVVRDENDVGHHSRHELHDLRVVASIMTKRSTLNSCILLPHGAELTADRTHCVE